MKLPAGFVRCALLFAACAGCAAMLGCGGAADPPSATPSNLAERMGNPAEGKKLIVSYGCGACHVVPGIYTARGAVGPPLYFWARRTMIAGELPNTPDNLVRWLINPPAIEPRTAMPDLGLTQQQATDIAAYLYTIH